MKTKYNSCYLKYNYYISTFKILNFLDFEYFYYYYYFYFSYLTLCLNDFQLFLSFINYKLHSLIKSSLSDYKEYSILANKEHDLIILEFLLTIKL